MWVSSTRPKVIRNSEGMLCSTSAESVQMAGTFLRCSEHSRQYLLATINSLPFYGSHDNLANISTMDEVQGTLCHIFGNKVGGSSGILPEMVKVCSGDLLKCLLKLFTHVWDSRKIPHDCKDALLILVPKKGDLLL